MARYKQIRTGKIMEGFNWTANEFQEISPHWFIEAIKNKRMEIVRSPTLALRIEIFPGTYQWVHPGDWVMVDRNKLIRGVSKKSFMGFYVRVCDFFPIEEDMPVCDKGSNISGPSPCSFESSGSCEYVRK